VMRLGFQVWGQYITWPDLMAAGREIDEMGFEELWSNDHLLPATSADLGLSESHDGPVFEGWATLFGWAAVTHSARLGCLVSGGGYRNPGLLVKTATALDHASNGRATLGLGAGWFEREHRMFGFEYPSLKERLDRFEELVAICRGLLDGDKVTFDGRWFQASEALNDPPPLQPRLPVMVGGSGEKRTLPIVARYADIWNADQDDVESFTRRSALLDDLCRKRGRDPGTIERTAGLPIPCIRATREAAVEALAEILGNQAMTRGEAIGVATASPFVGTVDAVVAELRRYRDAGLQAVMFNWPFPFDRQTLDALAGPVRRELEVG
jgi:F420-dependent oxidoreductase-like protein